MGGRAAVTLETTGRVREPHWLITLTCWSACSRCSPCSQAGLLRISQHAVNWDDVTFQSDLLKWNDFWKSPARLMNIDCSSICSYCLGLLWFKNILAVNLFETVLATVAAPAALNRRNTNPDSHWCLVFFFSVQLLHSYYMFITFIFLSLCFCLVSAHKCETVQSSPWWTSEVLVLVTEVHHGTVHTV